MLATERISQLDREKFTLVGSQAHRGFANTIREIFDHRDLLSLLVRRDLKSRFKDSSLGLLWTLVKPAVQLLIYYVVIGQFLGAERNLPGFAIYVFIGITSYGLFSEMVSGGTASIVNNAGLIKKIYLPREVFPLAAVGGALFTFAVQLSIVLIACLVTAQFPLGLNLLYLIPGITVLVIYDIAFGLLLSAVNVYLRDVQYLVEVLLLLLLWASPILYGWSMVKESIGAAAGGLILEIYTNNPVTLSILAFQKALWKQGIGVAEYPPYLDLRLAVAGVIGIIVLYFAQRVFTRLQGNFAQAF